jgi:hypothetical protein
MRDARFENSALAPTTLWLVDCAAGVAMPFQPGAPDIAFETDRTAAL